MIDILIKNCQIIDPFGKFSDCNYLAIQENLIHKIGNDFRDNSKMIIDAKGCYLSHGFIDIHCHPSAGLNWLGFSADEHGLNCGVTLLCDGGGSGESNFHEFKKYVVEKSKSDVICFLNIASHGLSELPEIKNIFDIDIEKTIAVIEANRNIIKGIKIRAIEDLQHTVGLKAIEMAKNVARRCKLPLMLHIGESRKRRRNDPFDAFSHSAVSMLDNGDILSHYLTWEAGGLISEDGEVFPELPEARKRGVMLDSCHGLNHFSSKIAKYALNQGFMPDVISSDLSRPSIQAVQSLAVVMSKFLNLGLTIENIIDMTTRKPSMIINESQNYGRLLPGANANAVIFEILDGAFTFYDGNNNESFIGKKLIEPRYVLKNGKLMPAYSNYHLTDQFQNKN